MEQSRDVVVGTVDKRPESPDTGAYSGGAQALEVSIGLGIVVAATIGFVIFRKRRVNRK